MTQAARILIDDPVQKPESIESALAETFLNQEQAVSHEPIHTTGTRLTEKAARPIRVHMHPEFGVLSDKNKQCRSEMHVCGEILQARS